MKDLITKLQTALSAIQSDPDSLLTILQEANDTLAALSESANTYATNEEQMQVRLAKLQEVNRQYISQIPIGGAEPPADPNAQKAPTEITNEEIAQYFVNLKEGGQL